MLCDQIDDVGTIVPKPKYEHEYTTRIEGMFFST